MAKQPSKSDSSRSPSVDRAVSCVHVGVGVEWCVREKLTLKKKNYLVVYIIHLLLPEETGTTRRQTRTGATSLEVQQHTITVST